MPDQSSKEFDPLEAGLRTIGWMWLATLVVALGEIGVPALQSNPLTLGAIANTFVSIYQISSGCLGALALYLFLPLRKRELAVVLLFGGALEAALFPMRFGFYKAWFAAFLATGAGFGLAAMIALAWRASRGESPRERKLAKACLLLAPLFPLGGISGAWLSRIAHLAQPLVYDTWAYAIDCSFGFSPSFIMSSVVTSSQASSWAFYAVYSHLSLFTVIAGGLCLTKGRADGVYYNVLAALAVSAIAGSLMFNIWPCTGPGNLFGMRYHGEGFIPWNSPPVPTDLRAIAAPIELSRRAMPSMHATFCLLSAIVMMRHRRVAFRYLAWIFFVMTLFSAAYIGHYLIDFVVALPLTLVMVGLTSYPQLTTVRARVEAVAAGLATLIVCFWGFVGHANFLASSPALVIASEVGIVLMFVTVEGRLYRSGATVVSSGLQAPTATLG